MAVRPIDANAMLSELRPVSFEAEHSAVLLSDVSKMMREWVERQPTLTPPNEPMTLEEVAEILAEQCGGECACDFNGNDEWLPEVCRYENVCPHHPEHLCCWMEFLRNRNRRPPEGEEET